MIPKEFEYSEQAHYAHGSAFKVKTVNIIDQNIVVTSDGKSFQVSFPDVLEKYILPYVESDAVVQQWRTDWMPFWQTSLSGVRRLAVELISITIWKKTGMIGSLFRFHVYYQTRRILSEMAIALLQDTSWNAFDNTYNRSAYKRICNEFHVDINADWRQKQSDNQGLGLIYTYWINMGYHPFDKGTEYDKKDYLFTQATSNDIIHIDYIAQGTEATKAWTTLILDDSKGFTKAGVERINDSIRTYCWAILGAQSQTRTDILGTGTTSSCQRRRCNQSSSFLPTSKMQSIIQLTSPAASIATRMYCNMPLRHWILPSGLGSTSPRVICPCNWVMSRATTTILWSSSPWKRHSVLTRGSTSQCKSTIPKTISNSKERLQHQLGLIARSRLITRGQPLCNNTQSW